MSFPHWTLNPPANIRKTNQASERVREREKKKKGIDPLNCFNVSFNCNFVSLVIYLKLD